MEEKTIKNIEIICGSRILHNLEHLCKLYNIKYLQVGRVANLHFSQAKAVITGLHKVKLTENQVFKILSFLQNKIPTNVCILTEYDIRHQYLFHEIEK